MQVFSNMVRMVQKAQAELVFAIEEKQRKTSQWAQGLIVELEREIAMLKTRNSEIDHLACTDDHIYFLQVESYNRKTKKESRRRLSKFAKSHLVILLVGCSYSCSLLS